MRSRSSFVAAPPSAGARRPARTNGEGGRAALAVDLYLRETRSNWSATRGRWRSSSRARGGGFTRPPSTCSCGSTVVRRASQAPVRACLRHACATHLLAGGAKDLEEVVAKAHLRERALLALQSSMLHTTRRRSLRRREANETVESPAGRREIRNTTGSDQGGFPYPAVPGHDTSTAPAYSL
jgi:hypothetical protein